MSTPTGTPTSTAAGTPTSTAAGTPTSTAAGTPTSTSTWGAGPVAVPRVEVRLSGSVLPDESARMLRTVRVRREISSPAACSLELVGTRAGELDDVLATVEVGAEVTLTLDAWSDTFFHGEVVTVEHRYGPDGSSTLTVRAQDRAHRWRQDSRLRVFVDVTVAGLVEEVADEIGLGVDAAQPGPRWPQVVQDGRSTLNLVTDLCGRAGLWWQVDADGDRVRVVASGVGAHDAGPAVEVTWGETLLEAVVTRSAVGVHDSWRVTGWDPVTGGVADETSQSSTVDLDAVGSVSASGGVVGGTSTAGPDHAAAHAAALTAAGTGRSRSLRAVVRGDVRLVPGVTLTVQGVAAQAAGDYVVLTADHVVDTVGGYTCTVSSAPPPHLRPGRLGADSVGRPWTTPGEVLRVDDPEERGRVRVALTAYDRLESEWLPVLSLGAGEGKGLTVQPDVGDHVLVAHDVGDPGRGVVLGGVRSSGGSEPAAGVADGAVGAYALQLPGGQVVRLSAATDLVRLANAAGSRLDLHEDGVHLTAAGDLVVEAPGRTITLRAARINMERG
ncbi:contractile injection system protein, VgrG/Pvc8 family [Cellulomonas sp. ATA003]|uniref:contractile injection system protein, VgrG/Pvc8 family n=1 Tax=Cellulomonas sp. ATA003 TaxID=3073064 RepID=UPI00287307AD|nr:contractile injection system protein, VgrG/Pvc8 family [Cellulomonas sp. ATA003]WNB87301.1 contractile injection system protein, VgrG/Pvc8 family [Cellulomonas sp. ATA003]